MKHLIIAIVMLSAILLCADEIKLTTPEGTFSFQVNQVNSDGSVQSGAIIDQIGAKLELLEKDHLSKLSRLDQARAKNVLDEIYSLLATLPADSRVTIKQPLAPAQPTQQPNAGLTINLNVSEPQTPPPAQPVTQAPAKPQTPPPAPMPVETTHTPMTSGEFSGLVSNVENESFADDKLSVVRIAAKSHWFTMDQLIQLVGLFSFSEEKVESVRIVYPRVVDPENAHNLMSAFTFSDDKQAVQRIIDKD
jgi:hypothetical protein